MYVVEDVATSRLQMALESSAVWERSKATAVGMSWPRSGDTRLRPEESNQKGRLLWNLCHAHLTTMGISWKCTLLAVSNHIPNHTESNVSRLQACSHQSISILCRSLQYTHTHTHIYIYTIYIYIYTIHICCIIIYNIYIYVIHAYDIWLHYLSLFLLLLVLLLSSCIMYHASCIMHYVSCIMYHVSCIMDPSS